MKKKLNICDDLFQIFYYQQIETMHIFDSFALFRLKTYLGVRDGDMNSEQSNTLS